MHKWQMGPKKENLAKSQLKGEQAVIGDNF